MGTKLAESLSSGNVLDYISLSDDFSIAEVGVPAIWIGKSIVQLLVRNNYGIALLAVRRGADMNISPGANFVFEEGDVVLALGENDKLDKLKNL